MDEINTKVARAFSQLEEAAEKRNEEERKSCQEENEAPCSVCGKSEFVMKYRNVSGKTEGKISGSFSLFGGSIHGYIDGETHTDAVLSCRECENERIIVIPDFVSYIDIWKEQASGLFTGDMFKFARVSDWLKQYGLEVALEVNKKVLFVNDYNSFYEYTSVSTHPKFTKEEFEQLGLVRKYEVEGNWYAEQYSSSGLSIGATVWIVLGIFALLLIIVSANY